MVVHDKNEPDLSKLVPIIIETSTIDALTVQLGHLYEKVPSVEV